MWVALRVSDELEVPSTEKEVLAVKKKNEGEFHEPRLSWTSNKPDARQTHYMGMHGRVSVAAVLAHMENIAPGVAPEDMFLNYATLTWETDPTAEDIAEREARQAAHLAKTEEWQRRMYAEWHAKFGNEND